MHDFNLNEFHHRYVFCLDADDRIHPIPAYQYDRLQAGYPDAAISQLAGQRVRFATFHVAHRSDPMRIADELFHVLPLDAEGNVDAQQDYDALQADVDRLEANDYELLEETEPTDITDTDTTGTVNNTEPTDTSESLTSWVPDPFTHRRLIAALLDAHEQPWTSWWPQNPGRAA
ncbi:MAG: hypothetical protein AAGF11_34675 [Myxococcota bacterium]